jgi:hypothetical protein
MMSTTENETPETDGLDRVTSTIWVQEEHLESIHTKSGSQVSSLPLMLCDGRSCRGSVQIITCRTRTVGFGVTRC